MWWGLRAYNGAYATAGSAAIQICTASDALCTTIHVASTGGLSAADITTSTCASSCTIKEWFDQTGNGQNLIQSTISKRATFVQSCLGSLPCAEFASAANGGYESANSYSQSQPYTVLWVAKRTGGTTTDSAVVTTDANTGTAIYSEFASTANQILAYSGTSVTIAANDNVWHFAGAQFNSSTGGGNNSVITADSSQLTGQNTGSTAVAIATHIDMGCTNLSSGFPTRLLTGNIMEAGVWPSGISAANQATQNTNAHTYWGF